MSPIHKLHLEVTREMLSQFGIKEIRYVLCDEPAVRL